jgi:hypothetical protein
MRFLFYYTLFSTFNFAQFDWQDDGASIRQGLHIEWQRTGDANADGSMIYAWSDCRNGVRDVVAQKVDAEGNNLWGEYGVVAVNASGRQEDPQLVTDGDGGAYIIWMDYRDESDAEGDIYAQHVLSNGTLGWDPAGLALVNQSGQQSSPNICSDGQEGAYVIWKDNVASSYGDIYATHLSSEGAIAPGEGVPIITYSSYRSSPSLNTGGSGAAVLVWSDDRNADEDLYAQRISVGNNTINTEWGSGGKLICGASGEQTSPRVSQYGVDNTIITWEDGRNGNTDAYYQILDGSGNETLTDGGVSACTGDWQIIKPRVKAKNAVAYIVWEDRRNGWTSDIYAQKINSDGSTAWVENGLEITIADGSQTEPRLDTDGSGGVYFVWEDGRHSDETGFDIYAQHISSEGAITYDDDGKLICDAENKQFNPLIRNDGTGGAFIVWGDQRTDGSYGMYFQHLTDTGINFDEDGKESFFGISTDAANEPYNHGVIYLENNEALVYWQDNRWGQSKIYGTNISSSFDGTGDIFSEDVNGQLLTDLDLAQETPKAILAGDKIFLSFKVEESPNENLYLQLLNLDLSPYGSATALADPSTANQAFDMVYGDDGYIYYAYSENTNIALKKLYIDGSTEWMELVVDSNEGDNVVQAIYPLPESGCVIIYENQFWQTGTHIYALAVDETGQVQNGWPINLSNLSENQYYESSTLTNDGIFISFKDNTSGNYDVYGQHVLFDGSLLSASGIAIADGTDDQEESAVAYDSVADEALVCYESPDGSEIDIHCNEVDLSTQEVGDELVISDDMDNQKNPSVYWSGDSFMIAWEDSRNTATLNSGVDIYFQEYKDDAFFFPSGGQAITTFVQKQERPIISQYTDDSFVIIWEDYRSTGKEFCANLYGQSYTRCDDGDMNGDGGWNVLDIVALANCVLAGNCLDLENACAGDLNGDGGYNVLDIVALANCVLADSCGGRVDDASHSTLIIDDNIVSIEADGFIGGVQMTLKHGDDFSIEMTDRALFADYLTTGNETRLLVITPETEDLFIYEGEFEITELIVANSQNEVSVDLPLAASFSISDAYPNPFNPTTTMTLTMPVSGEMQVDVYNLLGQSVASLTSGYKDAGIYNLTWDASDVSSGMYFVKAQADGFTKTQKLMLIK